VSFDEVDEVDDVDDTRDVVIEDNNTAESGPTYDRKSTKLGVDFI
jgi:hypothetical protein